MARAGNPDWLPKNLPPVILASVSPRRSDLLRELGIDFRVVPSEAAELSSSEFTARELAQINAYRKARVVARRFPDALVLGADTVVSVGPVFFGKPGTLEAAYEMLERLQGRTHEVITAICLLHLREHRQKIITDQTEVTFRHLDAPAIRRYLAHVNPLDKAGGYAIQEKGDLLVEKICGSFTNVVGLPVEILREQLTG